MDFADILEHPAFHSEFQRWLERTEKRIAWQEDSACRRLGRDLPVRGVRRARRQLH